MLESTVFTAFVLGIVSACSLPLGTLTSAVWRPGDRVLAVLMAFGGGALLAALTIDLVASALARGHFYALAAGCVIGGLLFELLNQTINRRGGFLRKTSTTIQHLQRQQQQRASLALPHLGRIPAFRELAQPEAMELAGMMRQEESPEGVMLYQSQDPADHLYIIAEGEVELLDPGNRMQPFQLLKKNDAFARMAFLTHATHATVARTRSQVRLWVLPRSSLDRGLAALPGLRSALAELIDGEEVATYLRQRHRLAEPHIEDWVEEAVAAVLAGEGIPPVVDVDRRMEEFEEVAGRLRRLPIFRGIGAEEVREVSARLFHRRYKRGEMLFQNGERGERFFIIERGEVALLDPSTPGQSPMKLYGRDVFGGLSFLVGLPHTVSALTTMETDVWVLRRRDFEALLQRCPAFEQRVRDYLGKGDLTLYLKDKQALSQDRTTRWIRRASRSMDQGGLLPAAPPQGGRAASHGAPLAIWLGILLDGIPESLVIGASLLHSHISLSLIAGLFLSNYPEALSSSVGMREQGMRFSRVLWMWTSLMLITGIGAALGSLFFIGVDPWLFALVQGVAAGAMLTMIAETMLPEAYLKGGSVVGLSTLFGFLAAIFFKTLE